MGRGCWADDGDDSMQVMRDGQGMLGMAVMMVGRGLWAVDGGDGRWEMMLVSMTCRDKSS